MRVKRRSKRGPVVPWRWLWALALFVEIAAAVATSPWTALRGVNVVGAYPRDHHWIATTLGRRAGTPVMRLDLEGIRASLLHEPRVKEAEVVRGLDGRLTVRLAYRLPYARVEGAKWIADVDREGVPFQRSAGSRPYAIRLRGGEKVALGKPMSVLAGPMEVLRAVEEGELAESATVTVDSDARICLNLGASATVYFGAGDRITDKLVVLQTILDREPTLLDRVEYLDLKCPEAPAVKRRNAGPKPPQEGSNPE